MNLIIGPVLCLLPLVLVLAFIFRKRKEQRALSCAPFKELQRRPAGETLRIELEALEEQLTDDALEGCQGLFSYFDFHRIKGVFVHGLGYLEFRCFI